MHVSSALTLDLFHNHWFLQIVFTAFLLTLGLLYMLKSTALKYFVVDAHFDSSSPEYPSTSSSSLFLTRNRYMSGILDAATSVSSGCAVCGKTTTKKCSGCKLVKYCSQTCQSEHWTSDHKRKCGSARAKRNTTSVGLVPPGGSSKILKQVDKVLFPYEEFVKLFNSDRPEFQPCGLLNCGNSCFANVVLQCLTHTRPLLSYLLDKGHKRECRRNQWCFFCELETHIERATRSHFPFSPINILSRLPSLGGNLGCGRQEDAHEFMRFAIDTMQSVCLDEHGGGKAVHPKSQETTLIQHIFGGQLQSQVVCMQCNQVSSQYENMMDLTVEIQGDATSLEECLNQYTKKESLFGENMYKCDGCDSYVKAWKRLNILKAPNILTIALKRFQSGRFGKLNKRITFPEILDIGPYMSEEGEGGDRYSLYAVVVHVDMLNASYFGHYICYTKGVAGGWYKIDDCKVSRVELDEVLSQGAYMLMYSRVSVRPACLKTFEPVEKHHVDVDKLDGEDRLVDSLNSGGPDNDGGDIDGRLLEKNPDLSKFHLQTVPPQSPDFQNRATETYLMMENGVGVTGEMSSDDTDSPKQTGSSAIIGFPANVPAYPVPRTYPGSILGPYSTSGETHRHWPKGFQTMGDRKDIFEMDLQMDSCTSMESEGASSHRDGFGVGANENSFDHFCVVNGDVNLFQEGHVDSSIPRLQQSGADDTDISGDELSVYKSTL